MNTSILVNAAPLETAPETKRLVALLQPLPVGTRVPYEKLSEAIRLDVQLPDGRKYLCKAMAVCRRDHSQNWDYARGIGVIRLSDDEFVGLVAHKINLTRKRMKRLVRISTNVDYEGLSEEKKRVHNSNQMILRSVVAMTGKDVQLHFQKTLPTASNGMLPDSQKLIDYFKKF